MFGLFESEEGPWDVQVRSWSRTGPMGAKSPQHLLANRKMYMQPGIPF